MTSQLVGVEPRHLATLVALAEEETFVAAATRLGCAQSAVSQRIAQIERVVGETLVERTSGRAGAALTPTGRVMAEHARMILAQLHAALTDLGALSEEAVLSLGMHGQACPHGALLLIERLGELLPGLCVATRVTPSSRAARAQDVRRGALDVALDDLPLPPGPFAWLEVGRDPLVLIVPSDSPLAATQLLPRLDLLVGVPLIADASWPLPEGVAERLRAAGLTLRIVERDASSPTLQDLVAQEGGAAILPGLAVDPDDPRIAVVALDGLLPARRIGLYWHAQRRQLDGLEPLREAVERACAEFALPEHTAAAAAR